MAGKYLVDTNAVIDYLNNKLPVKAAQMLDEEELEISVITRMELLAWRNAAPLQLQRRFSISLLFSLLTANRKLLAGFRLIFQGINEITEA